jgi:hypothetical protein
MSRTHRRHLAPDDAARRGGTRRSKTGSDDRTDRLRPVRKPNKADRRATRTALRKEYP